MPIYTDRTLNFACDPAIQAQNKIGTIAIVQPYIDSGYCSAESTWTPPLPDGVYPPTSGSYTQRRTWTDLSQAQACIAEVDTWLDANPACIEFGPLPTIVQV
jgi:hypothetical protein